MITIIDYKTGNLASIANMLKKIGCPSVITSSAEEIDRANKLILPGVGAFDTGMRNLIALGLLEVLNRKVLEDRVPILGICLGMQLFVGESEEGELPGLGWIEGSVVKFKPELSEKKLKVPHMSWNHTALRKESRLFDEMYDEPRFYFVHSFHVQLNREEDILAETGYGYWFTSALERSNIGGVQFHPEKSHKFGMKLLKNFAEKY
ncbi:MAG TPA: imidazole glycerol phosphate synthase subunit HisH [Blastocatellia bacterium]|nr:imidazole glycerol phosphate synthase subunit HisH [Blastocatellia bacterium]